MVLSSLQLARPDCAGEPDAEQIVKERGFFDEAGVRLLLAAIVFCLEAVRKGFALAMLSEDTLSAAALVVRGEALLRSQSHSKYVLVAVVVSVLVAVAG